MVPDSADALRRSRCHPTAGVTWLTFDGITVIHRRSDGYMGDLNESASEIWTLLMDDRETLADAVNQLARRHRLTLADAQDAVGNLVGSAAQLGLVTVDPPLDRGPRTDLMHEPSDPGDSPGHERWSPSPDS